MPWIWILILIVGVYVVVKTVQGIRDLVSWWAEGRAFAREQKLARQRRRQGRRANPPPLKERPVLPTNPPTSVSARSTTLRPMGDQPVGPEACRADAHCLEEVEHVGTQQSKRRQAEETDTAKTQCREGPGP
jgi:hypothetical protein